MTEQYVQNKIQLAVSAQTGGFTCRTNAGQAWQGTRVWSHEFSCYVLTAIRPIKLLVPGFSDLLYIGPDADIAFLEVKTDSGKARQDQTKFLRQMQAYGHKAGIVRNEKDALALIRGQYALLK